MFLPWDGFGVVALINYSETDDPSAVAYRAIDNVLGLRTSIVASPTVHDGDPFVQCRAQPSPSPSNDMVAGLPLPLHAYEGTYSHPAYDSITLCSHMSTSHHCTRVVSDFKKVYPRLGSFDLFAEWPRLWVKHAHLRPQAENRFEVAPTTLFPDGYGNNKTAFSQWLYQTYAGEFVVRNGTVRGLVLAESFESLPDLGTGRDLNDVADVYFEKNG